MSPLKATSLHTIFTLKKAFAFAVGAAAAYGTHTTGTDPTISAVIGVAAGIAVGASFKKPKP